MEGDPSHDLLFVEQFTTAPIPCARLAGSRERTICLLKAMVLFALAIGTAIDGPAIWLDSGAYRLAVLVRLEMACDMFAEARLVSERKANPCDNRIPLALFGGGIID